MEHECWWCGRNEWTGWVTEDDGGTFYFCHRHEDQVRSLIEEPEEATDG